MEIYCPTCQKKLQIADSYAGQTVQCPACAANFQAPALPSSEPLPTPEPLVSAPTATPASAAPYNLAPEPTRPTPSPPTPEYPQHAPDSKPKSKGEYSRTFTITLRQQVVKLIPSIGLITLFFLSFFPWRNWGFGFVNKLNLWELAFSEGGLAVFVAYVLLLVVSAPFVLLPPFLERNMLPTPVALRPYLPWVPLVAAVLLVVTWVLFLSHYLQCTFLDAIDLATVGMKLAFRLHTLIAAAALADLWLQRRKQRELPEPQISLRW